MKARSILSASALAISAAALLAVGPAMGAQPATGTYVEARNANVFVGACHMGSEYGAMGRDAILAWHVDSGALKGLNVVAAVAAQNNLAEKSAARSSVLYVDSRANAAQAAQLADLAKHEAGASLGSVSSVRTEPIQFAAAGDRFEVKVGKVAAIVASRLPDRKCCTMPYMVWYHPLASVEHPIVGTAVENQYAGADLASTWSYPGQNSAFIGEFKAGS